jgi:hypothetical protein
LPTSPGRRLSGSGSIPSAFALTVANGALASILRCLFPTAVAESAAAIDELERRFASSAQTVVPLGI